MDRINVTQTFLPPIEEYQAYLKQIWNNGIVTNQGPLLKEFENKTSDYLGVSGFHFVGNGTIALQVAMRALNITDGEIITTPFSYVATTSAILWERCTPVYVDIQPDTLCIDADKIEAAITKNTKAIMPVHVFGNPCDIEKIELIAQRYNLKVIYDAAHAFGVEYGGKSLLNYGDVSTCSFHATKLFQTIEGGAIITSNKELSEKIELVKRFGHNGDDHYTLGINAKASEFQAAMGLCNLKYIDDIIEKRKKLFDAYNRLLINKVKVRTLITKTEYNYAYYPIVLESERRLLHIIKELNKENIFPRRYFYPALNTLPYIQDAQSCPIAEDISKRVMCLPLYPSLSEKEIKRICKIIATSQEVDA